jgi:glycosyltransferase involved in cell wall biosynthesis
VKVPTYVIYIHHERAIGGAPLSLLYLLQQIDRKKYSPLVICLREGPAAQLFRKEGIPVYVVPGPDLSHTVLVWFRWWQWPKLLGRLFASIPLYFHLRSTLSTWTALIPPEDSPAPVPKSIGYSAPPIVHLNSSTLVVAAMAAKSLGLPVVWHIREPLARGYFGFRRRLLQKAIHRFADHVIAISQHDANQLGDIPLSRLSIVYNFVDFARFDAVKTVGGIRRELFIPKDAPVVLFLGGSAEVKGAEVLLQAATEILGTLRTVHLIIAGETSDEFKARARSGRLSTIDKRLHLVGTRDDVPSLLADSTLLVFPSIVPHFARPVIEAAAMAKPAVASDVEGVRELVVRNETAILVPPSDAVALARAVIDVIQDTALAYRLGQQALALAYKKFDAVRNAAETFAIYHRFDHPTEEQSK